MVYSNGRHGCVCSQDEVHVSPLGGEGGASE